MSPKLVNHCVLYEGSSQVDLLSVLNMSHAFLEVLVKSFSYIQEHTLAWMSV